MAFPEMPWNLVASHAATGKRIYQRTVNFTHTGNNEGTMTDAIEVRNADEIVLLATEMSLDWEYHCTIDAEFADDGRTLVVTGRVGADSRVKRLEIPAAPKLT